MKRVFDLYGDPLEDAPDETVRPPPAEPPKASGAAFGIDLVLDFALSVYRRRYLFLLLSTTAGSVFVLAAYFLLKPVYKAEAMLEVAPIMPRIAHTGEEWRATSITGFYTDYVRTLTQKLKSREVMDETLAQLEADGVDWLLPAIEEWEAPYHLAGRLGVTHTRETHLVRIGFEDGELTVVAPVVNTVAEKFIEVIERDEESKRRHQLDSLESERTRLRGQLLEAYGKLDELSEAIGSAVMDDRQNIFYDRLHVLQEGMTKIFVARVQAEGDLQDAKARARELAGEAPSGMVQRALDEDAIVRDTRTMYARLVRDIEARVGELSDQHPERAQALKQLEQARSKVVEVEQQTLTRLAARIRDERTEEALALLGKAARKAESARESEGLMKEVLGEAREDLMGYGRAMFEGSQLRKEAEFLLGAINRLDSRIEEILIESHAPPRVTVIDRAVEPVYPASSKRKVGALAGLVFAGGGSAMFAYLLSRLRRRVYGPVELRMAGSKRLTGIPVKGFESAVSELFLELEKPVQQGGSTVLVVPAGAAETEHARGLAQHLLLAFGRAQEGLYVDLLEERDDELRETHSVGVNRVTLWFPGTPWQVRAQLVASREFRERFKGEEGAAELLVMGLPPAGSSSIYLPFAHEGRPTVVVARKGKTPYSELRATVKALRESGCNVLGVALADGRVDPPEWLEEAPPIERPLAG